MLANKGAAGVDGGQTWEAFAANLENELAKLHEELRQKIQRPQPGKRVYMPKANGGRKPTHPIYYQIGSGIRPSAAIIHSLFFRFLAQILSPTDNLYGIIELVVTLYMGETIRLRAPEMGDLEAYWRWVNDPAVNAFRWEGQQWAKSRDQVRKDLEQTVHGRPDKMEMIVDLPDGRPIGFVSLGGLDRHNGKAELSIVLGEREAWGHGYGSEAVRQVLAMAFDNLRLNKVWLQVDAVHSKAIASYERLGFKVEGRLREDWYRRGEFADTVVMGLLAREWRQSRVAEPTTSEI